MEHQHKIRWAVTLMAVVLLLLTAANLFALKEIFGLRQELKTTTNSLNSTISGWSDTLSDLQGSLDKAKEELQSSIEQEDSRLAEFFCEMGKYDPIGETVKLTLKATPKEYREGVNVLFMYQCDDASSITVAGERDENGVFQKEIEIPMCDVMKIKVIISDGGVIYTETVESAYDVRKRIITPLGL